MKRAFAEPHISQLSLPSAATKPSGIYDSIHKNFKTIKIETGPKEEDNFNKVILSATALNPINPPLIQGRIQNKILCFALGSLSFMLNKLQHGESLGHIDRRYPLINTLAGIPYYTAWDGKGIARGGTLPWLSFPDIFEGSRMNAQEKYTAFRALLSRLPGNVAFSFSMFATHPDLEAVAKAFRKSGFIHSTRNTYVYKSAAEHADVLSQMRPDARNKINAARRDLEIVSMDVDEYFDFYKKNLIASGKSCFFNLDIDKALVKEAVKSNQIQIIATRRKITDASQPPMPIEAAIILTRGDDGYIKLLRITYINEASDLEFTPHKHATKFLVYEAMCRAVKNGKALDTDGYTPGGSTLYSRFGVFHAETRHYFDRKTALTILGKIVPAFMRSQ